MKPAAADSLRADCSSSRGPVVRGGALWCLRPHDEVWGNYKLASAVAGRFVATEIPRSLYVFSASFVQHLEHAVPQRQEIGVRIRCHQHELHSCCCPRPRRPRRSRMETRLPDLVQARQVHVKPYMASASRRSLRDSCRSTYECIISPPAGMSHAATIRAEAGRLVCWTSTTPSAVGA